MTAQPLWVYTHNRKGRREQFNNMPRFDGQGPQGYGPMTGRGMGPCGFRGCGRSFRSPINQRQLLEEEEKMLKEELEIIKREKEALDKE